MATWPVFPILVVCLEQQYQLYLFLSLLSLSLSPLHPSWSRSANFSSLLLYLNCKILLLAGSAQGCKTDKGWEGGGNCSPSFRTWGKVCQWWWYHRSVLMQIVILCLSFEQNLKDGAATAVEQLHEAESETKALRSMTQRMILTQEEMVCPFMFKLLFLLHA